MNSKIEVVTKDYTIHVDNSYNNLINIILNKYSSDIRFCIITDSNVGRFYLKKIYNLLNQNNNVITYIIGAGENNKSIDNFYKMHKFLLYNNFSRNDILIALGGGVVGDITGFVASTYMRGIKYIQLPTTLLSQVDSSIGGKTAINIENIKNIIGSFYNPDLVYINTNTLLTLDKKQLLSGYAEILKAAIINSNKLFEEFRNQDFKDFSNIQNLIQEAINIKKFYVENDFKENNIRIMLNFGHTIGHSIESLYSNIFSHGECVAYGMLISVNISYLRGYLVEGSYCSIKEQISRLIDINKISDFDIKKIITQISYDKKNINKNTKWILLNEISKPLIISDIKKEEIYEAFYKNL